MAPKSKKPRTAQPPKAPKQAPLGALLGSKSPVQIDESELELEEAVFGKSSAAGRGSIWDDFEGVAAGEYGQEPEEEEEEEETGLERLRDENLFFVDVPAPQPSSKKRPASSSDGSSSSEGEAEPESESESPAPIASTSTFSTVLKSTNRRKAAWYDPADEELTVSLKDVARLRKLRLNPGEDMVGGLEYEGRLRRQFEKMHPAPKWAVDARRKVLRRRAKIARGGAIENIDDDEADEGEESDSEEDEVDDLFRSAGASLISRRPKGKRGALKSGEVDIDRVRDANQAESSSSSVVSIGFHPRAQVLFSATSDRRLRLFQIDGTDNSLLQTLHVPELPITTASFHPSGSSILLTGSRPFFMSYDLQSGAVLRSPRGLLTGGLGGSDKAATGSMGGMERTKFSPEGTMLAIGGRRGYVHLVDWGKNGVSNGGMVVGEVKMNVAVKGIAWQKEGRELVTLGEDSEVYVWDVGTRRCVQRWRDEGGFGGCAIETDGRDGFTAVGSTTGIVNVYNAESAVNVSQGAERKSLKAVGNLTTTVTTMQFNHDAQILAIASKTNKDALKLVHLPSATVFSNWPTQSTPLHHVTSVDFSKGSEYLAVGNARGKVLLYTLKHYGI